MKTPTITTVTSFGVLGLLHTAAFAGSVVNEMAPTVASSGFEQARRPISNPTLFDLALPTTNVHPIFLYHALPDQISAGGAKVPFGGDVQLYALQFEYALSDRLSIVATKDGYVDMMSSTRAMAQGISVVSWEAASPERFSSRAVIYSTSEQPMLQTIQTSFRQRLVSARASRIP